MKRLAILLLLLASPAWGVTNTWTGTTNTTYSTATNWDQGHKPAAGEDVVFSNAVNCNMDEDTAVVNSWVMTGYSGTLSGTGAIKVTCAADAAFTLAGTITNTGAPVLAAASGKVLTVTWGGATTFTGVTIGVATTGIGTVTFTDALTLGATRTLTLAYGTLKTDGASDNSGLTHSWGLFNFSNSNTRTLTLGNSTIGITGTGNVWAAITSTNLTFTGSTSTINFTGASATMIHSGPGPDRTYGTINATGSGSFSIQSSITIGTFTRTASAVPTDSLIIGATGVPALPVITGSLTLNGNSTTNRLLVYSSVLGGASTFVCGGATVTTNNMGFRDITLRPAAASGMTIASVGDNGSGKCRFTCTTDPGLVASTSKITIAGFSGGNAGYNGNKTIAAYSSAGKYFETSTDYAATGTGTWTYDCTNAGANLIGDCGGNSGITFTPAVTETATGSSANWSAATWTSTPGGYNRAPLPQDTATISLTAGQTLTCDMPRLGSNITFGTATQLTVSSVDVTSYGSVNLTGMGTFTRTKAWNFESSARSGTVSLICATNSFYTTNFSMAGTAVLSLDDAFSSNHLVTCASTNSLNLNGFTHTLSRNASVWTGAGTITPGTSTIAITDTSSTAKFFSGGGKTYWNLTCPTGTGGVTINDTGNAFNSVTVPADGLLKVLSGSSQTFGAFPATGTSGHPATLSAVTASSAFTLTKSGGGTSVNDWLDVTDCTGSPGSTWYCGANGNLVRASGWAKTAGPTIPVITYYHRMMQQ
jgi:hypothetical protein